MPALDKLGMSLKSALTESRHKTLSPCWDAAYCPNTARANLVLDTLNHPLEEAMNSAALYNFLVWETYRNG